MRYALYKRMSVALFSKHCHNMEFLIILCTIVQYLVQSYDVIVIVFLRITIRFTREDLMRCLCCSKSLLELHLVMLMAAVRIKYRLLLINTVVYRKRLFGIG